MARYLGPKCKLARREGTDLFLKSARRGGLGGGSHIGSVLVAYFFAPAIALRGPLRVRALVRVRWPRTGSPFRCRVPR